MSTDSAAERRRFAELFVKAEFERTRKELAFKSPSMTPGNAYTHRRRASRPTTNPNRRRRGPIHAQRTALILRLGSMTGRNRLIKLLQGHPGQLDVHVVGARGDDAALRDWAATSHCWNRRSPRQGNTQSRRSIPHGSRSAGHLPQGWGRAMGARRVMQALVGAVLGRRCDVRDPPTARI